MTAKPYNGHESWNAWNVALWIGNDEPLYRAAIETMDRYPRGRRKTWNQAAAVFIRDYGLTRTPDGARYSVHSVSLALGGLES